MSMSAQGQLYMTMRQDAAAPGSGVVLEHDDEVVSSEAIECAVDIAQLREASLAVVLHAGNVYAVVAPSFSIPAMTILEESRRMMRHSFISSVHPISI